MHIGKSWLWGLVGALTLGCTLAFAVPSQHTAPGYSPASPLPDTLYPPLRILSWNIYMLPKFAKITGKRQRAAIIATKMKLAHYDILVFQEAFLEDARRIIWNGLQDIFPYQYGPANLKLSIKANSGIWVLSRWEMKPLAEIDFTDCEGFDDCFARKGALLLASTSMRRPFQILGTHLQAGGPHAIRQRQMDEIRTLLDAHRQQYVPQIVCGDMNTAMGDSLLYRDMLQRLDAQDGPLHIELPTVAGGYPNDLHAGGVRNLRIIDYIFLRPNGYDELSPGRRMFNIVEEWSPRHDDLSDHFPVEMVVDL